MFISLKLFQNCNLNQQNNVNLHIDIYNLTTSIDLPELREVPELQGVERSRALRHRYTIS